MATYKIDKSIAFQNLANKREHQQHVTICHKSKERKELLLLIELNLKNVDQLSQKMDHLTKEDEKDI